MKKPNTCKNRRIRRRKRLIRRITRVFTGVAVIVLILCTAYLARGIFMHYRSNQIANEVRYIGHNASLAEAVSPSPTILTIQETADPSTDIVLQTEVSYTETALPSSTPIAGSEDNSALAENEIITNEEPVMQEQFYELYERNSDLIGWIYVNENIDYPIVWLDEDNDFYMNHDYDKNVSDSGWIFLDKRNAHDMSDDHLLIYGHNMRVGTMFGELDRYRELDYIREHPIIELQSIYDEEPRKYVIFALFDASMNKSHSTYIKITRFNFETPEEKQDYIDAICSRSFFDLPCDAMHTDRLVTLVTCSYSYSNGRFLVVARELREDENAEQIEAMYRN